MANYFDNKSQISDENFKVCIQNRAANNFIFLNYDYGKVTLRENRIVADLACKLDKNISLEETKELLQQAISICSYLCQCTV